MIKFSYAEWLPLSHGIQAAVLLAAWLAGTPQIWLVALVVVISIGVCNWYRTFRYQRTILDTPTSKVASAAQGYVEFVGRSESIPGHQVLSKLSGLPCVWYRYSVEQRRNQRWHSIDSGQSTTSFVLRDSSGSCVVDPHNAQIMTTRTDRWTQGEYRFSETLLLAQDTLYVLGELRTSGGAHSALSTRQDLGTLLGDWKRDQPALLTRFDLDGNGALDTKEWELARFAAQRDVRQRHQAVQSQPGTLSVRQPEDGRPFLISNLPPERLARRYLVWNRVNVAGLVVSGVGLMYCLYCLGWR